MTDLFQKRSFRILPITTSEDENVCWGAVQEDIAALRSEMKELLGQSELECCSQFVYTTV